MQPVHTKLAWFQYSPWDSLLVGLALLQGTVGVLVLSYSPQGWWGLLALLSFSVGIWWNANTISHNHLHNPFFRSRLLNRCFSLYLTLLLSIPQTLWKERHLWHHAGEPAHLAKKPWSRQKSLEFGLIGILWLWLLVYTPNFFLWVFLPGYGLGLALCQMQGYCEHLGEATPTAGVSYYGRLYNWIWLNDGFHAEHHQDPRRHWTLHPQTTQTPPSHHTPPSHMPTPDTPDTSVVRVSSWPPFLRWLAFLPTVLPAVWSSLICRCLGWLERSSFLWQHSQRWMIARHQQAFRSLLTDQTFATFVSQRTEPLRIGIVGGGLFPRTLLALHPLLPDSHFTLIDENPHSLDMARQYLTQHQFSGIVAYCAERYPPAQRDVFDVLVFPLAYSGDRQRVLLHPPAPFTFLHQWCWSSAPGESVVVSYLLLKQLTLVKSNASRESEGF